MILQRSSNISHVFVRGDFTLMENYNTLARYFTQMEIHILGESTTAKCTEMEFWYTKMRKGSLSETSLTVRP